MSLIFKIIKLTTFALLTNVYALDYIIESNNILKYRKKIAEYSDKHIYLINQRDPILNEFNKSNIIEDSEHFKIDQMTQYLNTSYIWNLDLIDGNRDNEYDYFYSGYGVPVYVIDTGITRLPNFENRIQKGISFIDNNTDDCIGHGTHVSSIIASKLYGVSKNSIIVPVKIFGCKGTATTSIILSALDWIKTQKKGIINMSISGSYNYVLDQMVKELFKKGFVVVVSAGNNGLDACDYSPASTKEAITVGSYNYDLSISDFSNEGKCVDVFAPGNLIIGEYPNGKFVSSTGTSQAAPHVSAISAQILEKYPSYEPKDIVDYLINNSKNTLMNFKNKESPNRLAIVPGLKKCIEIFSSIVCNSRNECNWFPVHGCRSINFCGFRLKSKCQNYKRCEWKNNRCSLKKL